MCMIDSHVKLLSCTQLLELKSESTESAKLLLFWVKEQYSVEVIQ